MQLSDRQDFPQFNRNLDRKNSLPARKNTTAAPVRGIVPPGPKLRFSQVQNFKKEGIASFPATPRLLKTVHAKTNENKEKWAENLTRFSPRQPPLCSDSSQIGMSWSTSLEL